MRSTSARVEEQNGVFADRARALAEDGCLGLRIRDAAEQPAEQLAIVREDVELGVQGGAESRADVVGRGEQRLDLDRAPGVRALVVGEDWTPPSRTRHRNER